MPDEVRLYDLAEVVQGVRRHHAIRILYVLFESEAHYVCDILPSCWTCPSRPYHQLRVLKQARLVRSQREGKTVFYFLADDHVRTIIGPGHETHRGMTVGRRATYERPKTLSERRRKRK